jgi:arylsulfatase A-like enzyme
MRRTPQTEATAMSDINRTILPIPESVDRRATPVDMRDADQAYQVPPEVRAPEGAPNVLLVLVDDVGFGATSSFGGPCHTPTTERLAQTGLRYTRFHTTALCASTRTALLTGRNHHSCNMGAIPELGTLVPGNTGVRPRSTATVARTLSGNDYATAAFGKMHQTPTREQSPAGPFDRWPTREGFDRFYGFLGAETDQFTPNLYEGLTQIEPPRTPEEGYHLSEDLVDQAIGWIDAMQALDPEKPWFCYLSYGACHAPFHVPEDWRARYRGAFGHGWDEQRERTLARQKELGVVPADAELAPWSGGLPHWDELTDAQRQVGERLMEAYAAFLEHTDVQTGRLIDALERSGQLHNTLVIYIQGDNGASAEGGVNGTLNEWADNNGVVETPEQMLERLDDIGGPYSYALYPAGWALAMNTPYQWTKQVASHYGGTRNGMVVHWPAGIPNGGELRHQWHHCIDVVPTILEAAGIPEPLEVDGVAQKPIEGTSFLYTFVDGDAADRHTTQYFEMFGNRGIYHHGWTAVTKHRIPWERLTTDLPALSEDRWELYDTSTDWTQARDLAQEQPERLRALQELFIAEAAKYQVLPIDDRLAMRWNPATAGRPDLMGHRTSATLLRSLPGLKEDTAPNVKNTSFNITAELVVPEAGADGVLIAQGGRFGGWSLYVKDGNLCYCYNLAGVERSYVRADRPLQPGKHTVTLGFRYDGGGIGKGGDATLVVDGERVGAGRIEATTPVGFSADETLDLGRDRGTPVTEEYPSHPRENAYGGVIDRVHISLGDDGIDPPPEDVQRAVLTVH